MRLKLFCTIAAAAAILGSTVAAKAQSSEPASTIAVFQSSERVLVMLRIGDHPPMPAVFDTGTNGNLVDLKVAERIGLPRRGDSRSIDGSTGKPVPGFETFIAGASLGGVPIDDARATAFAFDFPNEVAIVGPNSFPSRFVEMDLGASELRVFADKPAAAAGEGFPYLGEGGAALPSLTIEIAGRSIPAILDTGNTSDFLLPLSLAADLPLKAPPVVIGEATSAAGTQAIYGATLIGDVMVAGVVVSNPRLRFMEGGRPNIGHPMLRRLKILFDPSNRRSWVLN